VLQFKICLFLQHIFSFFVSALAFKYVRINNVRPELIPKALRHVGQLERTRVKHFLNHIINVNKYLLTFLKIRLKN